MHLQAWTKDILQHSHSPDIPKRQLGKGTVEANPLVKPEGFLPLWNSPQWSHNIPTIRNPCGNHPMFDQCLRFFYSDKVGISTKIGQMFEACVEGRLEDAQLLQEVGWKWALWVAQNQPILLLKAKAEVSASSKNESGRTPLQEAQRSFVLASGNVAIVCVLYAEGCVSFMSYPIPAKSIVFQCK